MSERVAIYLATGDDGFGKQRDEVASADGFFTKIGKRRALVLNAPQGRNWHHWFLPSWRRRERIRLLCVRPMLAGEVIEDPRRPF